MGYAETDDQYRTRYNRIFHAAVIAANIVPPRFVPPEPAPPNAATTTAQWKLHDYQKAGCDNFNAGQVLFKRLLIDSLGSTIVSELEDVETGMLYVTSLDIINHVTRTYGTPRSSDIQELKDGLNQAFTDPSLFRQEVAVLQHKFLLLARFGHPKSNSDQVDYLIAATRHLPGIAGLIANQSSNSDDPVAITFAARVTYVNAHYTPSIVVSAAGYSAATVASAATSSAPIVARRPPRTAPASHRYCYFHGYGHSGNVCNHMADNPALFTAAQIGSTSPTAVPGGSTKGSYRAPPTK